MAIPFFGEIEKLINEHGSATILKERISLANDKYSALEKKTIVLESKVSELQSENERLKMDNIQLRQEIQRRDDIIEKQKNNAFHDNLLEEIKVKILLYISKQSNTADEISAELQVGIEVIKFHLNELKDSAMISAEHISMGVGNVWSLEQSGRKYLILNNLIK